MRILVWELKNPAGGVEHMIMNVIRHIENKNMIFDVVVKGNEFAFADEIISRGGKVYYMPNYLPNVVGYRNKLKEILSNENYDAVWCNFSGLTNIELLKLAKSKGINIRIAHSHVTKITWGSKLAKLIVVPLHNFNKQTVDKYATDFWCCTLDSGKYLFPKKVWNKLIVRKNAIDLSKFQFNSESRKAIRNEYGINDELVVGHIGRLTIAKNQKFLIDVFSELLKKAPTAKLMMVGGGELKDEIIDYAKTKGIINNVIFIDQTNDTTKYYSAMDVFVLPSLFEGLSLVLVEAQSCGLSCVVSSNVSKESDVLGNMKFIDLNKPCSFWADEIIESSKNRTSDTKQKITDAGFNIDIEAKAIEYFFER